MCIGENHSKPYPADNPDEPSDDDVKQSKRQTDDDGKRLVVSVLKLRETRRQAALREANLSHDQDAVEHLRNSAPEDDETNTAEREPDLAVTYEEIRDCEAWKKWGDPTEGVRVSAKFTPDGIAQSPELGTGTILAVRAGLCE